MHTRAKHFRRGAGDRLLRSLQHIDEHIEQTIRLQELADVAAMSPFHFARQFKRLTGKAPMRYVLARRVEAAKALIESGELMNAEIAYRCGFASQSHLCTAFKAITGKTPTEWRDSDA